MRKVQATKAVEVSSKTLINFNKFLNRKYEINFIVINDYILI